MQLTTGTNLIIADRPGEVLGVHINDAVLSDGLIDLDKIKPLVRLGYQEYTAVDNVFKMTRPSD